MPVDTRLARLEAAAREPSRHIDVLASLEDPELSMRRLAIAVAARYLTPELLLPLVRDDENATRRNSARTVLRRQAPASFEVARLLLRDSDPDVVIIALEVLSDDPSIETFQLVHGLLAHPNTNIAVAAIEAIWHFGPQLALGPLVQALSGDTWRRMACITALGAMGDPQAVAHIVPWLGDKKVEGACIAALAAIRSEQAFCAIATVASTTEEVRGFARAICALGTILDNLSDPLGACRHLARTFSASVVQRLASLVAAEDRDTRRAALALLAFLEPEAWLERAVTDRAPCDMAGGTRTTLAWLAGEHRRLLLASTDPMCRSAMLELAPSAATGDELLMLLRDPDRGVRTGATLALAARGGTQAANQVIQLLLESGPGPDMERLASALIRLGDAAKPAFATAFAIPGSDTQLAALLSCCPLCAMTPARQNDLRAWSRATSTDLRQQAVSVAARLSTPIACQIVLDALSDSDPRVSALAAQALAKKGQVARVIDALARPSLSRFRLISALAQPGLYSAVEHLITLYAKAAPHEQVEIVTTLGRIGGNAALGFLAQQAKDREPAVRRAAAEAVAVRATPADEDKLVAFSQDSEWSVRRWAVEGLSRVASNRARRALVDLARDIDDDVAQAARQALGLPCVASR